MFLQPRPNGVGGVLRFLQQLEGKITSTSTVHSGTLSVRGAFCLQLSGSRIGFSFPTTRAAPTSSPNLNQVSPDSALAGNQCFCVQALRQYRECVRSGSGSASGWGVDSRGPAQEPRVYAEYLRPRPQRRARDYQCL